MNQLINWVNSWTLGGQLSIVFFGVFAALVYLAAKKLVNHSDAIVVNTKLGGNFFGAVVIAAITSMPELITEVVQASSGFPGAGNADDLGSNAFSTFLLAIGAIVFAKNQMFINKIQGWTKTTILMTFVLSIYVFFMIFFSLDVAIGNNDLVIGLVPLSLFVFYVVLLVCQYKLGNEDEGLTRKKQKNFRLSKTVFWFSVSALFLICFSFLLNVFAASMKEGYNLDESSVGGIFLSISTSLPEIVSFLLLLRKKHEKAAVMTLFGSHVFNLGISFFGDLAYTQDATFLTESVHDNWPIALMNVVMLGFLLIHVFFLSNQKSKIIYLTTPSLIMATYLVGWTMMLVM